MGLFDGTAWEREIVCETCEQPEDQCTCPPAEEAAEPFVDPSTQRLRLRIEKRKKGKSVTVISGLQGPNEQNKELLSQLKTGCGTGGTLRESTIEIQGKHDVALKKLLADFGYTRVEG